MEVKPIYHLANFSGGKDSTAMVLRMIELGYELDEVIFCDTTMDFPAMKRHIERVKRVIEAAGVKFTTLRAEHDFEYYLLRHKPKRKNDKHEGFLGYSWPGPQSRWCTKALKVSIIDRYVRSLLQKYEVVQYIGLAADEDYRLERKNNQNETHRHPLRGWGWTEAEALAYCYEKGYDWEGLYETFDRVSCWCCPLQSLSELRKLRAHFPELWQHLALLDSQTWRDFKPDGWSVEKLEKRFSFEEAMAAEGHKLKGKRFYEDLKRHCFEDVSLETILQERQEEKT